MDDLLAARSQMAMSLAFHIIFAAIGIAMPALMVTTRTRPTRTHRGSDQSRVGSESRLVDLGAPCKDRRADCSRGHQPDLVGRRFTCFHRDLCDQCIHWALDSTLPSRAILRRRAGHADFAGSLAQFPNLVEPDIIIASAAAPALTLELLLAAVVAGAVVLFPSYYYLFRIFKLNRSGG
jgi:hypothetical protein